jgi:hypothetical protein
LLLSNQLMLRSHSKLIQSEMVGAKHSSKQANKPR